MAAHPRAPRRLALRTIREFYTFDLMQFALLPSAPADLRRRAEELLITRLSSITLGERLSLARRCSSVVAAALLVDSEARVWRAALENPRITEVVVVNALRRGKVTPAFVEAVCRHAKWPQRPEIQIALLGNPHTPLERAVDYARRVTPAALRDVLHNSRLPEDTKEYLRKESRRELRTKN